jgi:hypothetical protein
LSLKDQLRQKTVITLNADIAYPRQYINVPPEVYKVHPSAILKYKEEREEERYVN